MQIAGALVTGHPRGGVLASTPIRSRSARGLFSVMFESVAPETFVPHSRKLFYESLPMSIAAHAMLAVAFVVAATWEVAFPQNSPRVAMTYSLELEPTPPPPPPAPPPHQDQTPVRLEPERTLAPDEIVAPTVIPDIIPVLQPMMQPVEHSVSDPTVGGPAVQGWSGEGGTGKSGGDIGGVPDGVEGGVASDVLPPNTILVKRYQSLPMSLVPMSMVYPFYPEEARLRGWEDAVAVRYVIGTDGRVRNVEVLERPQRELFQKTVVKAIRNWRFKPLVKNGVPQEVIHELVVYFKLQA
jgi:protein TonB